MESGELLPWGAKREELSEIGSPRVLNEGIRTDIHWSMQNVLDGLEVSISITLHGKERASQFTLHFDGSADNDARDTFERVASHLDQMTTEPGERKYHSDGWPPSGRWQLAKTVIAHLWIFDRFGEVCFLDIRGRTRGQIKDC